MILGGCRQFWVDTGGFQRSEFKRSRQLWEIFLVSYNNDANDPLKQMTKFFGHSKYKVSIKKTWVREAFLMKIDIYNFM